MGRVIPAHQLTGAGVRYQIAEARVDFLVDRRAALVPPVAPTGSALWVGAAVGQPEVYDVGDDWLFGY